MRAPSLILTFLLLIAAYQSNAQDPVVTVRFANPEYVCASQTYNVDVEFQCNIPNRQLFGMNVRFYYPDDILEFTSFGEFAEGYAAVMPDPPYITTCSSSTCMTSLGFTGPREYVNGAIQKTSTSSVYMLTAGWTKIFNVSFHVDDTNVMNLDNFCPSVVWDLNEAATGGIGPGIIISVVNNAPPPATESVNAIEQCVQFNWAYDGIPGGPHGFPVETDCISTKSSYAPKTILPVIGIDAPGLINVPVTIENFTNIKYFTLVFRYSPTILTYVGNTTNPVFNAQNGLLSVVDAAAAGGLRKVTFTFQGNNVISLIDNDYLANIQFNYLGGSTDIAWRTNSNGCYYLDGNNVLKCDQPYSDYFINGMAISSLAPITKIDSAMAVTGDFVTFTVRVWDYEHINSGTLTLNYDPNVMAFQEIIPNSAIAGSFEVSDSFGSLVMDWGGDDISLADGSVLMYATFQYMGGEAALTWFDNGTSCQFINTNLMEPLSDEPTEDFFINGVIDCAVFTWTGENSDDWNSEANWIDGVVPDETINVVIDPASDPVNWPTFVGDFILGNNCKDLTLNDNAILTVTGDFTINPGHSLNLNGTATLIVGGNWINSGAFNPGTGTVEFTGANDAIIGTGVPADNFITSYILSTFPVGMTPLAGGLSGPSGDEAHSDVNIGFDFKYLGINYSQVRINSNGWLSLNLSGDDTNSGDNNLLFNTSFPTTALAPWWDDLNTDASTIISYLAEGEAPSRIFTVEWNNVLAYSTIATARLNFQVKLYETSNIIEFCYGNYISGDHNTAEGASIGIKNTIGGPENFIEATLNSTCIGLTFLRSNTKWPVLNYRFSPPPQNDMEEFYKVVVSKSSGVLSVQRDVKITGIE